VLVRQVGVLDTHRRFRRSAGDRIPSLGHLGALRVLRALERFQLGNLLVQGSLALRLGGLELLVKDLLYLQGRFLRQ